MKKTPQLPAILNALLMTAIFAMTTTTYASAPPSDTPPKMDPLDEGDPAVTHAKDKKTKLDEQLIQNGQNSEVKVTSGVGTYIVKSNSSVGTSLQGDAQSNNSTPAQWVVKSWGGSKSTDKMDEQPPVLPTNPNPPANK